MKTIKKSRLSTTLAVYLIIRREKEVLLLLRKNTGYMDGYYGMVSGHVENDESAVDAIIRETKEEAGITIAKENLSFVHTFHRKSDKPYIDLFFECSDYQGSITNAEPEKCADLSFHPLDSLPENMVDYVKHVLEAVSNKQIYSEDDWK